MTKISKSSWRFRTRKNRNKLSIQKLSWSICDESENSSSDEENQPILPRIASNLSTIHESQLEHGVDTDSVSSVSRYSSFNNSMSSLANWESRSQTRSQSHINNEDLHKSNEKNSSGNLNQHNGEASTSRNAKISSRSVTRDDESVTGIVVNVEPATNEESSNINKIHDSKNLAQALMNLALIAANANQIRYLIDTFENRPLFYVSLTLIIVSLLVQLLVKICLVVSCKYDLNNDVESRKALRINNWITLAILLITLVNMGVTAVLLLEMKGFLF